MKMEDINIPLVIGSAIVGSLIGLYCYGKYLKKKGNINNSRQNNGVIKVSGEDIKDLTENMEKEGFKKKVDFEFTSIFTFESLATWINETDLKDATDNVDIYGCLLVRTMNEISKFKIDVDSLTDEQKNKLYGVLVINTQNNDVIRQKWVVADAIDDDLSEALGNENLIVLK